MSHTKSVRYFRITPGDNSFLWEENVRDQNIRFDRYYDAHHNDEEQLQFIGLQVGDIVITNWDDRYILGVGRVSGPFKRIMRYRYFKQTVPVQWFDLQPRAIPIGEKLTTSWSEHTIQEISESEFQHLMDVCLVTDDEVVKNRFNLHLKKEESAIQKDLQEDKICDLIDRGKVKEALALVTIGNLDMVTDIAQDYLALKNYTLASMFYGKVIELDPGNLGVLNNLAFICLETGKYEEAIDYANLVLRFNPKYGCSWLNKGNALLKMALISLPKTNSMDSDEDRYIEPSENVKEKYRQAIEAFEKYVQIDATDEAAWRELAGCYSFLGRYEEALVSIEKALAITQDDYRTWNVKWICLYRLGRLEESDQVWKIMNELKKKEVSSGIKVSK